MADNPNRTAAIDVKVLRNSDLAPEVAVVVGTRPGIVMLGPVIKALEARGTRHFVIHTGQHYSPNMDAQFFDDLQLGTPAYRIEGTSERTTHGWQTAHMLGGIEDILLQRRPRLILVGGDANTNLAGALAARKLGISVGHVEAGERSYDWSMPEEHNRRMIDHISDLLFVTGDKAVANLAREGVQGRVIASGNPIVDASRMFADLALNRPGAAQRLRIGGPPYAVLTSHREENVDNPERLRRALQGVSDASRELGIPVRFFAHPRTRKRLREFALEDWLTSLPGIEVNEPASYLDFLALIAGSSVVFTDSGGVQQEACIHHVGCVTLRENTEWVETLEIGANRLAGSDPASIVKAARDALNAPRDWAVPFGDGTAAEKIADSVDDILA